MTTRVRKLLLVTLSTLFGVFSLTAPLMTPALRANRLGGDPAPGELHPRILEVRGLSGRKPVTRVTAGAEFADVQAEDDSDEERPRALEVPCARWNVWPVVQPGGTLSRASQRDADTDLRSSCLHLVLCQRLMC